MRLKLNWIVPLLIVSSFLAFSAPAQVVQTHVYGVFPTTLTETSTSVSERLETIEQAHTVMGFSFITMGALTQTLPNGVTAVIPQIVAPVAVPTFTIPAVEAWMTSTIELKQFMTTMTTVYTAETIQGIALEGIVGPLPSYSRSILLGVLLGLAVSVPISTYRHTKST